MISWFAGDLWIYSPEYADSPPGEQTFAYGSKSVNLQKSCAFDTGTLGTGRFKDLQHLVVYAAKDVDAGKIEQLKTSWPTRRA